jgi:hypothetical protein
MNDVLNGFAAKWLPRLAGVLAGWIVGWAANHKLTLDVEEVAGLILLAYQFVHRLISKYTNPGDATRTPLILKDKATVAASASDGVAAPAAPAQPVAPAPPFTLPGGP